jgi:hypothetical protein
MLRPTLLPERRAATMSSTLAVAHLNRSRVLHATKSGKIRKDEHHNVHTEHAYRAAVCIDAVPSDEMPLEAQIEGLKQVAAILRAELADMRAQRDGWRAKAEREKLAASKAVAARARAWWRRS